jgi:MFS family permease
MLSARDGLARRATFAAFFVAGWLPAAWATRVPTIKAELDLSAGALALGILGLEAGAIVGLPTGAALVARVGSRRALRIGFAAFAPGLLAVGVASSLPALAAALAAMALANSVVDVAMNAQGVELERRSRRALLSGLHTGHPLGLVVGGLAGAAAAAADLPVGAHFAIAGAVGLALALTSSAWLVAERDRGCQPALVRPSRRLLLLGLLAFCAFALDGAAYNWSAVDLRAEHDAPAALAAAAFSGFALALALGRVFGDRLVARFGRVRVVQACAGIAAAGGTLIALAPSAGLGLAGWALFGLGLAAVAPTVLGAAPRTGDAPPAVAIAAVTTVGYLGSFTGPPIIGALAEATSLSTALLALVAVSALLGLISRPALAQHAMATATPSHPGQRSRGRPA